MPRPRPADPPSRPAGARWRRGGLGAGAGALGAGLLAGLACSSPDVSGPRAASSFLAVTLAAHAVTLDTLAPYDTLTLVATARDAQGQPLAGAPVPTFTSSDSSVRVSSTGVLQARAVVGQVRVIAELVYQGIRRADTAYVTVTGSATPPPALDSLHLALPAGEGPTLPTPFGFPSSFYYPRSKPLEVAAYGAGEPIPQALVALRTSTPWQAAVPVATSSGDAQVEFAQDVSRPGPVWVYADAIVYGVAKRDSLLLTLTAPQFLFYTMGTRPDGSLGVAPDRPLTLGVGGVVWWVNSSTEAMLDVVFEAPLPGPVAADEGFFGLLNTGGGDIDQFLGCPQLLGCDNVRSRSFPTAGTYRWHSTAQPGLGGTIIVE